MNRLAVYSYLTRYPCRHTGSGRLFTLPLPDTNIPVSHAMTMGDVGEDKKRQVDSKQTNRHLAIVILAWLQTAFVRQLWKGRFIISASSQWDSHHDFPNEQTFSLQLSDSVSLWAYCHYWAWQTVHSTAGRKAKRFWTAWKLTDNYQMPVWPVHRSFARQLHM